MFKIYYNQDLKSGYAYFLQFMLFLILDPIVNRNL